MLKIFCLIMKKEILPMKEAICGYHWLDNYSKMKLVQYSTPYMGRCAFITKEEALECQKNTINGIEAKLVTFEEIQS